MGARAASGARSFRLALYLIPALIFNGEVEAAEKLRLAIQKTGTFAWELEIIKARGLDRRAGLDLEVRELASPEAAKIALNGGAADLILSDWLWVSRERGLGHPLVFVPYSTTHGGVMVGPKSEVRDLADLIGRGLAVAGGPLDKSWLLLQALALKSGLDLKARAEILYGAPALLYAKALSGEADATLIFWNYCVALEARGFRSLIGIDEVARQLGAKGPFAMVGYVFDERFARRNPETIKKFLTITAEAKAILATSDADWERIVPRTGTRDPAELALYRKAYVAGIPRRPIAEEEADARALYARLAEIGGPELVGSAKVLDPGTFYHSDTRPAPTEN
jgi:NitT/TauT family transport system substrate-binding protein